MKIVRQMITKNLVLYEQNQILSFKTYIAYVAIIMLL